jgi:hypothetical protein
MSKNRMKTKYLTLTLLLLIVCAGNLTAQTSSPKHSIVIDIAHKQRFWNDPARMRGMDKNQVERVRYHNN